MDKILSYQECYMRSLIDDGHCAPFVCIDDDGLIHVGDEGNHEVFHTLTEAEAYCRKARLKGKALQVAHDAFKDGTGDNRAAEYMWHCDAGLQLDALHTYFSKLTVSAPVNR